MSYNNILLSVNSSSPLIEGPCSDEEALEEIIYPGTLCENKRGLVLGVLTDSSIHACSHTGAQVSIMLIALEDLENGKTVNDRYFPGEIVPVRHLRPGDVFLGRLSDTGAYDQGSKFRAAGGDAGTFTGTTFWDTTMCYSYAAIEAGLAGRLVPLVVK